MKKYYFKKDDFGECFEECPIKRRSSYGFITMVGSTACQQDCENMIKYKKNHYSANWIKCKHVSKPSFNLFTWIKSLLTIILLAFTLSVSSQSFDFKIKPVTPAIDLGVLTATTAYWMYADNVQPDKVIHFMYGYFATQAMNYLLAPLDIPKGLKICTPIIVFGGLAIFKELADSQADWNDFKAGMLGCGLASISFTFTYQIKYK